MWTGRCQRRPCGVSTTSCNSRRRPGFGSESRGPDRRPRRWQDHSRCRPRPARGADFHRRGGPTGPRPSGTNTFSPRSHPPHGDSSPFSRSLERTGGARVQAFCRVPLRLAEGDRHTEQSRAVSPGTNAVCPAAAGFGCLVQSRRTADAARRLLANSFNLGAFEEECADVVGRVVENCAAAE